MAKLRALVLFLAVLLLTGCSSSATGLSSPPLPEAPTPISVATLGAVRAVVESPQNAGSFARVTAQELAQLLQSTDITLVHVHAMHEWEIPGTDLYIPIGQLRSRLAELPSKDAVVILYCRSGNTSQTAARLLAEQGYTNVKDLIGGYGAWYAAGYPLLDRR